MTAHVDPRAWRREKKLTMAGAAAAAGVTNRNPSRDWQRWERGERQPPPFVIAEIEKVSDGLVTARSWANVRRDFLQKINASRDAA